MIKRLAVLLLMLVLTAASGCTRLSPEIDIESNDNLTGNQSVRKPDERSGDQTEDPDESGGPSLPQGETEPAEPTEPAASQTSEPAPSNEPAKEANWVFEIDNTQHVTDEDGVIWNYRLTLYASKAGGEDVLGNYSGEMMLFIEPDRASVDKLAAEIEPGLDILAFYNKTSVEAQNLSFEVIAYDSEAYFAWLKKNLPGNLDIPVMPLVKPNAYTLSDVTAEVTVEPFSMTGTDGEHTGTVGNPGNESTVNIPFDITISGADVRCYIYGTPHPLLQSFDGIITGDVL